MGRSVQDVRWWGIGSIWPHSTRNCLHHSDKILSSLAKTGVQHSATVQHKNQSEQTIYCQTLFWSKGVWRVIRDIWGASGHYLSFYFYVWKLRNSAAILPVFWYMLIPGNGPSTALHLWIPNSIGPKATQVLNTWSLAHQAVKKMVPVQKSTLQVWF